MVTVKVHTNVKILFSLHLATSTETIHHELYLSAFYGFGSFYDTNTLNNTLLSKKYTLHAQRTQYKV